MADLPKSPLAPIAPQSLAPVEGVQIATGRMGTKYQGRDDLFCAKFGAGTIAAASFTQNQFKGAPVIWTQNAAQTADPRALIVNAGNANVANGAAGHTCTQAVADALAQAYDCAPDQIWQASTGVIGELLEPEPLIQTALAAPRADLAAAAAACLTTDTFIKTASRQIDLGGERVTISGFAKGSGMVQPNMATMLAFVFTDARLEKAALNAAHGAAVDQSFNAITVDSDTSTSDMALTFATGQGPLVAGAAMPAFAQGLVQVYQDLAKLVVRDGEGASKFVEISVAGAQDAASAKTLALSVANSPLVKTMIAGEDANWGRLLMALGKTSVPIDPGQVGVSIGGVEIARGGVRVPSYDETPVAKHMAGAEIQIDLSVGAGPGQARVWTCDLTHGYISINADYRS